MKEFPYSYDQRFKILSYHVDNEFYLKIPVLFSFMQEVALTHVTRLDFGWQFLGSRNLFWALSKFRVKIFRLPRWNEEILIRTWGKAHAAYTQPRDFQMFDAAGNLVMCATSVWIILDRTNFALQKLDDFEDKMFLLPEVDAMAEKAKKVRPLTLREAEQFKAVVYSDLDMNQHVNNTRYLQWLLDAPEFERRSVGQLAEVSVNYVAQARLGDAYAIQTESADNQLFTSVIWAKEERRELCRVETIWRQD